MRNPTDPIRVVLADDHELVRKGLVALLAGAADIAVVGEAGNGRDAVRITRDLGPDIVLMDVHMHDLNGVEATRQIHRLSPSTRVIGVSMHSYRAVVVRMLEAGASGYLLKDGPVDELLGAIRSVARGMIYLTPSVATAVVEASVAFTPEQRTSALAILTSRQREVFQLVAEGLNTKQVAARLHLSSKTVETHRQQLMKRLHIQGVADLTKCAIREGVIYLD